MAAGWAPVMQQSGTSATAITDMLANVEWETPAAGGSPRELDVPVEADELRRALRGCTRHKATGPDGLSNDWFRDHEARLVPLLVRHSGLGLQTGVLPSSFKEANVRCLKKCSAGTRPLVHRPIALLNAEYKVFTRVLAL